MNNKILSYLGIARKSGSVILGTDAVIASLKDKAKLVIIAEDASPSTIDKLTKKSFFYHVPYLTMFSTLSLDQALGRKNLKVLAITNQGIAEQILKLQKEGCSK